MAKKKNEEESEILQERDLEEARRVFQMQTSYPSITVNTSVRRRFRNKNFMAQDLLFEIDIGQEAKKAGNLPIIGHIMSVFGVLQELILRLRKYFNDKMKRVVFFEASVGSGMRSSLYSGGILLNKGSVSSVAQKVLRPLFAYLTSNAEANLRAGLKLKACVCSVAHTQERLSRPTGVSRSRDKRPPPAGRLIGQVLSERLALDDLVAEAPAVDRRRGWIRVAAGYPTAPDIFREKCVVISFAMSMMVIEAATASRIEYGSMVTALKNLPPSRSHRWSDRKRRETGEAVVARARALLEGTSVPFEGPHSYQDLETLCRRHDVQCAVFSGLTGASPAYYFPSGSDPRPDRPCLYLMELQSADPQARTQFHLNVVLIPSQLFNKHLCPLCLRVFCGGSNQLNHRTCPVRRTCYQCQRLSLNESDHYDLRHEKLFCPAHLSPRPSVLRLNGAWGQECETCQQTVYTACCRKIHLRRCHGQQSCPTCRAMIRAKKGQELSEAVAAHRCFQKRCPTCYHSVDRDEFKHHCCPMQKARFPRAFQSLGAFDIETFTKESGELVDMCLNFHWENERSGHFSEITFAHAAFVHRDVDRIKPRTFRGDYLPPGIGRTLREGKIPYRRAPSEERGTAAEEAEAHLGERDLKLNYRYYRANLRRFHHTVSEATRARPLFRFLCFLQSPRHRNRVLCAHFGGRFDLILLMNVALKMRLDVVPLTSGQGVTRLELPAWGIVFLDSYNYFPQPLASLPQRFQLEDIEKGNYAHAANVPSNWNLVRKHPPALAAYLNPRRDSKKDRERIEKWWREEHSRKPFYCHNSETVAYCRADVRVLVGAMVKFLQQGFAIQDLLTERFGDPLDWNPRLSHRYHHPFTSPVCTLGSFA